MRTFFICLLSLPILLLAQTYSADLCNDGTPTASSAWAGASTNDASKAFDNYWTPSNAWASNAVPTAAAPQWIKYDFGVGKDKKITQYTIRSRALSTDFARAPKNWFFEASNDNSNWTILDTQIGQTVWGVATTPPEIRYFPITNTNPYRYYRIRITANNGGTSYVAIGEIQMMSNIEDTYTNYPSKRGNIWYFGNKAGISFNTEPPIVITDGQLDAREGCATICDTSGNLLFYTNGSTVWNKNHSIMQNGDSLIVYNPANPLHSTQSGVIAPSPQDSVYYVFSTPCGWVSPANDRYFRYAVVDLRLNGGLGMVTQKNVRIGGGKTTERITAVAHANNNDIWIINHLDSSNTFQSYLITSSGIDTANPIISNIGSISSKDCNTGYLKASPDGKKLAMAFWCNAGGARFELYDFDAATGIISNLNDLGYPPGLSYTTAYGVEFSPDGTKLYGSTHMAKKIFQWNLNAGSNALIKSSRVQIATTSNYVGALQLAPDGRIYCALSINGNTGFERVAVIKYPNMIGTAAKYEDNGLYLEGKKSRQGFPNFIQTFLYRAIINSKYFCLDDSTQFWQSSVYMIDSVYWNFGDIASGIHNTSKFSSPKHKFSSHGSYNVQLVRYYSDGKTDVTTSIININPKPIVNLGNDTNLCPPTTSITLNAENNGSVFLWNNEHTGQTLTISNSGTYIVTVTNEHYCSKSDTIIVHPCMPPLPIQLLSFNAECYKYNEVLISWQTLSEINNDYFTIEKSHCGQNFKKIAMIKGAANSNAMVEYKYIDTLQDCNQAYYQLKQTDFDGKNEYCGIASVNCKNNSNSLRLVNIKNIEHDNISIQFITNFIGKHIYKIFDLDGKLICNGNIYCNEVGVCDFVANLPNGVFIVFIHNNIDAIYEKFIVFNNF